MHVRSKIFYASLFCLLYSLTPAVAQVEKGRLRIGGAFSASISKTSNDIDTGSGTYSYDQDQTSISFSPLGGIFLIDGLELGISPTVSWINRSSDNSSSSSDSENLNFQVGPYVNYYIGSGEHGKPFFGLSPKIGWGKSKQDSFIPQIGDVVSIETNTKLWSVGLTGGYAIFLNDSYLLSFYAGYEFSSTSSEQEGYSNSFDYDVSMFTLGVSISTTFKR